MLLGVSDYGAFVLAFILLLFLPGPGNLALVNSTAMGGLTGGLASIGGLLIGLIETFWSAYFTTDYKDVAAFSMLIIVLIFLPQGLLGRPEIEKV